MINKTKTCFWHRECAGLYRLGDITVEQIWHPDGICAGNNMWHVIINGKTIVKWAYLSDAKKTAHKIDREANKAIEPTDEAGGS